MLRAEEASTEAVHGCSSGFRACACPRGLGLDQLDDGAHGTGHRPAQIRPPPRRPQEQRRRRPHAGRKREPEETVRNDRVRRGNVRRQDEEQDRSGGCRRDVTAERAAEERHESDGSGGTRGEPGVAGAERPERDEHDTDSGKSEVRHEARSPQAAELHEHEHGERPERGEERRLRVPDDLIREREDARHDDRSARSRLQRLDVRHRARSYDRARGFPSRRPDSGGGTMVMLKRVRYSSSRSIKAALRE